MLAFFRALAAVLNALVPYIKERTRHARIERLKQGYFTRIEKVVDDPAAAFAEFDDDLRAEGILHEDHRGGVSRDQKDKPNDVSSITGLVD